LDWPSVDLCRSSPAPRQLDPEPEAELLRLAQSGDGRAARKLVLHHVPYIRAEAFKRWRRLNRKTFDQERTVQFKDFVAACLEDLSKAIKEWTPGNGLNAFARHHISGALSDIARDWRNKNGFTGLDSDLQREIRSHPSWPTEWIARLFATKFKVKRFEEQLSQQTFVEYVDEERGRAFAAMWKPTSYSEGAVADDEWFVEAGEYVTVVAATEIPAPEGIEGPTSDYTKRAAAGYRWGLEKQTRRRKRVVDKRGRNLRSWQHRHKRVAAPAWNDRLWHHYERHTRAFLKWMGRQRYIEWLIVKRKDAYCEVRNGQLVEPSNTPAPFESKVTIYYRGTPLAAAKLITVVQAKGVRHSAPWVGDVMIPRSTLSHGLEGPPVGMPIGQASEPAASRNLQHLPHSYWNSGGWNGRSLSRSLRSERTLNLQPLTMEERIDERQQWCDLAAITQPSKQRRKDEPHD
jgi:hypothetical protein